MTAQEHNKLLGIFFLIQGGLQVFGALFFGLIYGGMGFFVMTQSRQNEEQALGGIFIVLAIVIAAVIFVIAAVDLIAGLKLFRMRQNAKVWGIIASCISLFGFPIGTALGVYGLWFFFGEQGKQFYNGGQMSGSYQPPPPPQSWQ